MVRYLCGNFEKFLAEMQTRKVEISTKILQEATALFLEKGFLGTSMREIARRCDIVVGNIYNYYRDKDELLKVVTAPAVDALKAVAMSHKEQRLNYLESFGIDGDASRVVEEYLNLIEEFRTPLKVLLLRANGSALEDFSSVFAREHISGVRESLAELSRLYPDLNVVADVPDFVIYMSIIRIFTMIEELLKNGLPEMEAREFIRVSLEFESGVFLTRK